MSEKVKFDAISYGDGYSNEIVALVAGFGNKPGEFNRAASELARLGIDSVVYTYEPRVFLDGDASLLPALIDDIYEDFSAKSQGHQKRRYSGVSLGGAIAVNMQKRDESPEPGLFAATGDDAAKLIMHNPWFRAAVMLFHHVDVKKAFTRHGHNYDTLYQEWSDIHVPPDTGFTMALGGKDKLIREQTVVAKIDTWREQHPDRQVNVVTKRRLGHSAMISWFDHHIEQLADFNRMPVAA
jgi:hypothetical protein